MSSRKQEIWAIAQYCDHRIILLNQCALWLYLPLHQERSGWLRTSAPGRPGWPTPPQHRSPASWGPWRPGWGLLEERGHGQTGQFRAPTLRPERLLHIFSVLLLHAMKDKYLEPWQVKLREENLQFLICPIEFRFLASRFSFTDGRRSAKALFELFRAVKKISDPKNRCRRSFREAGARDLCGGSSDSPSPSCFCSVAPPTIVSFPLFWLFAVKTAVDDAGGATSPIGIFANVSYFHILYRLCVCVYSCRTANGNGLALWEDLWLVRKHHCVAVGQILVKPGYRLV